MNQRLWFSCGTLRSRNSERRKLCPIQPTPTRAAVGKKEVRNKLLESPLALKVAGGAQNRNRLVHHPLADAEVAIDPLLEVLVIGDFVGVETGAVKDSTRTPTRRLGAWSELVS